MFANLDVALGGGDALVAGNRRYDTHADALAGHAGDHRPPAAVA